MGWFRSKFADAKRIVTRFVAGIFERLWAAAMRLVSRLGIFDRSRPAV
jgi:hypothetical protein